MSKNPIVTIEIENGNVMKAELYPDIAPNTVNNFISLINKGFYDGVVFHRVIPGFMIQGGDPEGTGMWTHIHTENQSISECSSTPVPSGMGTQIPHNTCTSTPKGIGMGAEIHTNDTPTYQNLINKKKKNIYTAKIQYIC